VDFAGIDVRRGGDGLGAEQVHARSPGAKTDTDSNPALR
jgi:hypothetical protein